MRLADLLRSPVEDASGSRVGTVRDLRLRRDDSTGEIVVTAVVLGNGRFADAAHRWGFVEGRASGPWLFRRLARDARSAARVVAAEDVDRWSGDGLRLRPGASPQPLRRSDRS